MTRLTNYERDAFISAVMDDVPHIDYNEIARKALQNKAVSMLPPKVRALHKEFGHLFNSVHLYAVPGALGDVAVVGETRTLVLDEMKKDVTFWKSIEELGQAVRTQRDARKALESKIKAAIYGCTTIEKAHAVMPEFAKYLKKLAAPVDRTVPVIANLVADLNAAGWPRSKKPVKEKSDD